MAWTKQGIWDEDRSPRIDLILKGFNPFGDGRNKDRLKISAVTKDQKVFGRRVDMLKDLWNNRTMFDQVRLLAAETGAINIEELEAAYRQGAAELKALLDRKGSTSLNVHLGKFIREREIAGIRNTYQDEQSLLRFFAFLGASPTTSDITAPEKINAFLNGLTVISRKKGKGGVKIVTDTPMSASRRNGYRASIQSFCTYLERISAIPLSPFAKRKAIIKFNAARTMGKTVKRLPEMAPDEFKEYLRLIDEHRHGGPDFRLLAWCAIETGADKGEFHNEGGLTVRQIRFAMKKDELTRLRFIRTKTLHRGASEREVPVTPELAAELRTHITHHKLGPNDLVFGMCGYHTSSNIHQDVRVALGQPKLTQKDLRHVAAIRWRRMGADLEQIREWLDHGSIEQTRIYAAFKADDTYDSPIIAKIRKAFKAGTGSKREGIALVA